MAYNLRNRSFVKELDFTPEELNSCSSCQPTSRRLSTAALNAKAQGQEHRPDLREDLHPHPLRFRSGRL